MSSYSRFLISIAAVLVAGCGFHLRGSATLPFEVLYVEAPPGSLFGTQLRRIIGSSTKTRITTDQVQADATLQVVHELREKEIVALSAGGRVREFQLRYRVAYLLYDKKKSPLSPATEILLRRDFSFNDQDQLSKESEEALLFRDMQTDAVQQLLRRLEAIPRALAKEKE